VSKKINKLDFGKIYSDDDIFDYCYAYFKKNWRKKQYFDEFLIRPNYSQSDKRDKGSFLEPVRENKDFAFLFVQRNKKRGPVRETDGVKHPVLFHVPIASKSSESLVLGYGYYIATEKYQGEDEDEVTYEIFLLKDFTKTRGAFEDVWDEFEDKIFFNALSYDEKTSKAQLRKIHQDREKYLRKRTVEQYAVNKVIKALEKDNYLITDKQKVKGLGYDLVADSDGHLIYIEVKGRSRELSSLPLSQSQIKAARNHKDHWILIAVINIKVKKHREGYKATGGRVMLFQYIKRDGTFHVSRELKPLSISGVVPNL